MIKIHVFNFLKFGKDLGTDKFVKEISKQIRQDKNGFAGYKFEEGFETYLNNLSQRSSDNFSELKISDKEVKEIVEKNVRSVQNYIKEKEIFVYVFPHSSDFVIKKMGGITGRTVWKDTIYIEVFAFENWKEKFSNVMIHELTHLITGYYGQFTIGESLIHEGLAENFRESLLGGSEPWTKAISKIEVLKILKEIKSSMKIKDFNVYKEIFFGAGKYPNWSGYTIGYILVKDYLKNKYGDKINWREVFEKPVKDILKEALKIQDNNS